MKIRRYVMTLIQKANGEGVPLPSILELSELFGVSRPTVTRAMKALTEEGFVVGRRGLGSFTNPARRPGYLQHLPTVGILIGDGRIVHFDKYQSRIFAHLMMAVTDLPALVHVVTLSTGDPDIMFRDIVNEQLNSLIWQGINREHELEVMERLVDAGIMVITSEMSPLLNNKKSPAVRLGIEELGYECGKRLLAEGRRNLVYLPATGEWSRALNGIRMAYDEAGIGLNPNYMLSDPNKCLEELRQLLAYQAPVDAIFNALFIQNEISDMLTEFKVDTTTQCRLIESDLCIRDNNKFHGYTFGFPFAEFANNVTGFLRSHFSGNQLIPETKVTEIKLQFMK